MLGLGIGLRLLLPDEPSSSPIEGALVRIPLLAGAAVILLERLVRRGSAPNAAVWLVPLAILPGCFPTTALGVTRALDLVAALAAGIALRDLVIHDGFAATLRRWVLALGVVLCLVGLAQPLWQREQLREIVGDAWDAFPMARAFLESDRATATLVNANAFAGLLLLLLPLAIGGRSGRVGAGVMLVLVATFGATGSAGAALALLLAVGLRWREPGPLRRWWRGGFIVGLAGVLVLVVALATSWRPPLIDSKVDTFRQRIDYHSLGARMLPDAGMLGTGLEATRELRWAHARPDEWSSAYIHDTWFQLLIELGPVAMLAAAGGVLLVVRRRRDAGPTATPDPPRGLALAFGAGIVLGVGAAPMLNGVPRLLPLGWEFPLVDAILLGGCAFGVAHALRGIAAPTRAAWGVGILAFALHGLLDYDLYVPGVATTLCVVVALAPRRPISPGALDRPVLAVAALVLLALPLAAGLVALIRDDARIAVSAVRGGSSRQEHLLALENLVTTFPDAGALQALTRHPAAFERALATLPDAIRERPSYRRIEADHRARRRVLGEPQDISHLLRPGEFMEPWIRECMMRIAMVDGDTEARRRHARAGLAAMDRFAPHVNDADLRKSLLDGAR